MSVENEIALFYTRDFFPSGVSNEIRFDRDQYTCVCDLNVAQIFLRTERDYFSDHRYTRVTYLTCYGNTLDLQEAYKLSAEANQAAEEFNFSFSYYDRDGNFISEEEFNKQFPNNF